MTMFALASFMSLLCTVLALIKIFEKLWWGSNRLQRLMGSQGIRGPPYKLIHGSTKEIMSLQKEVMSKPLSGFSHVVFPKLQPHIHRWTNSYGKNYLQWIGSQAELVITELDLIKEVLNDRERTYAKNKTNTLVEKIFGDGLAATSGEKWAKMRKLANHAFQAESLKGMVPAMVASVEAMIKDGNSSEPEKRLMSSRNSQFFLQNKIYKSGDEREADKLEKGIHDSIKEIIKRREEKVITGEEESFGSDFLGLLLKNHHNADEKQRISVDEMVDECKTLYFAGQETTTSLLAWTVFLLAVHTDWQDEARKEVLDLFGKQNPKPDAISRLKSMSMIVNESLRLYPPAVAMTRNVEREVKLGDLIVPANVGLLIPILAIHHDTRVWGEDVHLFKPERFAEGVAKATKDNIAAFIPFGMGPRICAGFNFATTEVKIALAMILQRYTFALSPAYVHSPIHRLTARPQFGLQVILNSLRLSLWL